MPPRTDYKGLLVCPVTKRSLEFASREDAEARMGGVLKTRPELRNAKGGTSPPAGVTEEVVISEDAGVAYPVVDGIPVLLAPERLAVQHDDSFDLTDPRYAEAYEEMEFYNTAANGSLRRVREGGAWAVLPTEMAATEEEKRSFPAPWERWVDTPFDSAALWDAYTHLGKMGGRRMLQLGGSGTHSIKFAMVGAAEAWLITPMVGEALFARALADAVGVGDKFRAVVGIAEELPLRSESCDGIFAGGCLHHMLTDIALPEASRVLRRGGRFAAAEPWRGPLYGIGTRLLGKREDAYCKPLTAKRLERLDTSFSSFSINSHGTLTRYPLIALNKFGVPIKKSIPWHLGRIDDALCSVIPAVRRMGSSVAVLGTK